MWKGNVVEVIRVGKDREISDNDSKKKDMKHLNLSAETFSLQACFVNKFLKLLTWNMKKFYDYCHCVTGSLVLIDY